MERWFACSLRGASHAIADCEHVERCTRRRAAIMRDIARGGRLHSRRTTHVEAGCWRAALVRGMRARGAASAARCPAYGTWRGASQRAACCQPTALGAVRCNVQRASLCAPSKKEVSVDEIAETCSASPCVVRPTMCGGAGRLRLDWATSALPCGNNLLVHLHKNR